MVIANGKNAKGRSALTIKNMDDVFMCRFIVVQKEDREALEMLEVKVITPKCQKRSSKGSEYQDYVRNMLDKKMGSDICLPIRSLICLIRSHK